LRAQTRHQLKSNAFADATYETVAWAAERRRALIVAGVGAAVALAIGLGAWYWMRDRNVKANAELGAALLVYQAPVTGTNAPPPPEGGKSFPTVADRARAAQSLFAAIADKYGSTNAGKFARYFEALTYEDLNNYNTAEKLLKDVGDHGGKDVAGLAKYALGQAYAAQGRMAEATKVYNDLIAHPSDTVSKSTAQLAEAQMLEPTDPQQARRLYEQIRKDDPKSGAAETAEARLSALAKK
jgi:TolA-binding protein